MMSFQASWCSKSARPKFKMSEKEVEDEKRPTEEEEGEEEGEGEEEEVEVEDETAETFEIIRRRRVQDNNYWNVAVKKLGQLDLSRRPVYQQIGIGGVTGWCVGNVFKKMGKIAALGIGGGLLMVQLASQSGYVTINWKKISKDVGKVSKEVNTKFEEYTSEEQQGKIARYFRKGGKIVQTNMAVASGFAGGFLLGLAS